MQGEGRRAAAAAAAAKQVVVEAAQPITRIRLSAKDEG
jgi:hypothetical protein